MRSSTYTDDGDWKVGGKSENSIFGSRATDDSLDHILRFSAKERTGRLLRGGDPDSRDARELFLDPQFIPSTLTLRLTMARPPPSVSLSPSSSSYSSTAASAPPRWRFHRSSQITSATAMNILIPNFARLRAEFEECLALTSPREREVGALQIEKANRGCVFFFFLSSNDALPATLGAWISREGLISLPFLLSVSRSCANFGHLVR